MALNLWKTAGQPTSYNPLPGGYGNKYANANPNNYILTLRAKSASGTAVIRVTNDSATEFDIRYNLTTQFVVYTFNLSKKTNGNIMLVDLNSTGDIVIDSVNLVNAPLNQLTINGVDGFLSGKWNFTSDMGTDAGTVKFNDSTVQYTPTANYRNIFLEFPATPNTYTLSFINGTYGGYAQVGWVDINGTYSTINDGIGLGSTGLYTKSFTAPIGTVKLRVYFYNHSSGSLNVPYIFSNPIINLGTIPAPYSKKTGNTMVLPTAKKNLLNVSSNLSLNVSTSSALGSQSPSLIQSNIRVLPNTTYTVSLGTYTSSYNTFVVFTQQRTTNATNHNGVYSDIVGGNAGRQLTPVSGITSYTFTTASNEVYITVTSGNAGAGTFPATIGYNNLQLELGSATTYQPYNTQVNKTPRRFIPKKNLFDGNYAFSNFGIVNTINTVNSDGSFKVQNNSYATPRATSPNFPASWGGKTITCSVNVNSISGGQTYKLSVYDTKQSTYLVGTGFTATGIQSVTCTLPADCTGCQFWIHPDIVTSTASVTVSNAQAEFGTVATPYEAYTPVLPPSNKGMFFNGVSDYLTVPAMSIDAIEFDINIDPTQTTNQIMLQTSSTGTTNANTNGTIANISSVLVNGSTYSGTLPKGSRIKVRYNFTTPTNEIMDVLTNATKAYCVKSVLYSLKCYYQGNVVVSYDFTNPNTIAGNTVLNSPAPQNLLPSFEDPRWKIHANATVLGKNAMHLNATSAYQNSYIYIPTTQGQKYYFNAGGNGYIQVQEFDANYNNLGIYDKAWNGSNTTFTVSKPNAAFLGVNMMAGSSTGLFDFYNPVLYLLSGQEGTINGSPIPLMKPAKRLLYNKR